MVHIFLVYAHKRTCVVARLFHLAHLFSVCDQLRRQKRSVAHQMRQLEVGWVRYKVYIYLCSSICLMQLYFVVAVTFT